MAFIHADLDIPVLIHNEILPSPSLSILQWIQFQFPVTMVKESTNQPSTFFSESPPNEEDLSILCRLPIPHAQTVQILLSVYKKHLKAGISSVRGTCFECGGVELSQFASLAVGGIGVYQSMHKVTSLGETEALSMIYM
ncbi:hypothetical protein BT96DRAFT_939919 [Gymnopus androsaceus JB14]|uniref:Uncharacterized protein n=1 Tax=Gymnopus androsaceus JB14 TaxID=1447944 RepID=A0A6A4HMC2_9AGAR|nr:hypothetical protein BT96DRAFT_939919 [Gymnopus androsaceus JB14]